MREDLHDTKALVSQLYQYNSPKYTCSRALHLHAGSVRVVLCTNLLIAKPYWRCHFGIPTPPKRRRVPNTWQTCRIAKLLKRLKAWKIINVQTVLVDFAGLKMPNDHSILRTSSEIFEIVFFWEHHNRKIDTSDRCLNASKWCFKWFPNIPYHRFFSDEKVRKKVISKNLISNSWDFEIKKFQTFFIRKKSMIGDLRKSFKTSF